MEVREEVVEYILRLKLRAASEAVGRQDTAQEEGEAGVVVVVDLQGTGGSMFTPAEVADLFSRPRRRVS